MRADEIRRLIEASPLAPRSASIMARVRPAVRLRSFLAEDADLPLGASRLGGRPDLPAGIPWPENNGNPLAFLAQIDLAAVARLAVPLDLPAEGWLTLFYDVEEGFSEDPASWRMRWHEGEAQDLDRAANPAGPDFEFNLCAVQFEPEDCVPDVSEMALHMGEDTWETCRLLQEKINDTEDYNPVHRLGGHPMLIQTSAGDYGPDDFLLQIDSDAEVGWMWGDQGRLYFMSEPESPVKRALGNAAAALTHARHARRRRWARRFAGATRVAECY